MTKPSEMPGWPEAPKIVDNGAWLEYRGIKYHPRDSMMAHFAYKDDLYQAAMARLRAAVEHLAACEVQLRLLMHRAGANPHVIHATWQNATTALAAIGSLPPPQQQRTGDV